MGLALSDPTGVIALPLETVEYDSDRELMARIRDVCEREGVTSIVVGLPLNMNGSYGPMAEKANSFAEKLKECLEIEVMLVDERLSTCVVERVLIDADISRSRRKQVRDKLAAQNILQAHLDSLLPDCEPDEL